MPAIKADTNRTGKKDTRLREQAKNSRTIELHSEGEPEYESSI
jgi:hypothetical protein